MAIKSIKAKKDKIWTSCEIDLSGPDGNVFTLMAIAQGVCRYNGISSDHIIGGMKSDDYVNALKVFDYFLGGTFSLYCDDQTLALLKTRESSAPKRGKKGRK
jgi:hypothetical protein